jgi:hypothetical protein
MLEKQIEAKVCDYAKAKGMMVYKFTSPARAAVPDRLFILNGKVFFIEFKREGQKPTPAQEREHNRMRQHQINVFVVDNVEQGKSTINLMLQMIEARLC